MSELGFELVLPIVLAALVLAAVIRLRQKRANRSRHGAAVRPPAADPELPPDPRPPAPGPARPPGIPRPPPDLADFTGRRAVAAALAERLTTGGGIAAISAEDGLGGVGKSALAVHLAHRLAADYPAGQLFLDLAGSTGKPPSGADIMGRVILAFDPLAHLPADEKALGAVYHELLAGRKALLILDDAPGAAEIAPLLPLRPAAALITSRAPIILPSVTGQPLGVLGEEEASALLGAIAGPGRAGEAELALIARACGCVPLALRLAGASLAVHPAWRAAEYVERLEDQRGRLNEMEIPDHELDAAAALAVSAALLAGDDAELALNWRRLAVFAGDFEREAVAAVWDCADGAAGQGLGELSRRAMVLHDAERDRYRLHDLMRDAARREADEAVVMAMEEARLRHAVHYRGVLATADERYLKGGHDWAAGHGESSERAAGLCHEYADAGVYLLRLRLPPPEYIAWMGVAAEAARRIGNRRGEANALGNLGNAHAELGETGRATELYAQALEICREIGERGGEGDLLANLGGAHAAMGEARRAIGFHHQALEVCREMGDRRGEGRALGNLGGAHAALGETGRALEFYLPQLEIARRSGDRQAQGGALGNLGHAHAAMGEARRAIEYYEQQLEICREIGERGGEGKVLADLGGAHAGLGDRRRAIEYFTACLAIVRELRDRRAEGDALGDLGRAHAALGENERAVAFFGQQLAIVWERADRLGEAGALFSSARALRKLGAAPEALRRGQAALEIYEEIAPAEAETVRAALNGWQD